MFLVLTQSKLNPLKALRHSGLGQVLVNIFHFHSTGYPLSNLSPTVADTLSFSKVIFRVVMNELINKSQSYPPTNNRVAA